MNANVNPKKCLIKFYDLVFSLFLHSQYMYLYCKEKNEIVMFSMTARNIVLNIRRPMVDRLKFVENFSFLLRLLISRISHVLIDNII